MGIALGGGVVRRHQRKACSPVALAAEHCAWQQRLAAPSAARPAFVRRRGAVALRRAAFALGRGAFALRRGALVSGRHCAASWRLRAASWCICAAMAPSCCFGAQHSAVAASRFVLRCLRSVPHCRSAARGGASRCRRISLRAARVGCAGRSRRRGIAALPFALRTGVALAAAGRPAIAASPSCCTCGLCCPQQGVVLSLIAIARIWGATLPAATTTRHRDSGVSCYRCIAIARTWGGLRCPQQARHRVVALVLRVWAVLPQPASRQRCVALPLNAWAALPAAA